LENCNDITEKGVEHVIKSCRQLIEINFRGCLEVHGYIVSFMIFSRPSLITMFMPNLEISLPLQKCSHDAG
jgi:hypothetical protein